jgi:hypothetical protein
MSRVQFMTRLAALAAMLVLVAGCGGGSTGTKPAPRSATPSARTTSAATARPAANARVHTNAPSPSVASGRHAAASARAATRQLAVRQRYLTGLQQRCALSGRQRLPALPRSAAGARRWARVVTAIAQSKLRALSAQRAPQAAMEPVARLTGAYQQLMPYLQEVAASPPGPPSEVLERLVPLIAPAVEGLQSAAVATGAPACGLSL